MQSAKPVPHATLLRVAMTRVPWHSTINGGPTKVFSQCPIAACNNQRIDWAYFRLLSHLKIESFGQQRLQHKEQVLPGRMGAWGCLPNDIESVGLHPACAPYDLKFQHPIGVRNQSL